MIQDKGGIGKAMPPERQPARRTALTEDGPSALVKAISAVIRRTFLPLGIWVLVCLAAAFLYAQSLPPVYTATATLIFEAPSSSRGGPGETVVNRPLDLNRVDSQLQVIRSERLQRIVFENLGLATHPEVQPEPGVEAPAEMPTAINPAPALPDIGTALDVPALPEDSAQPENAMEQRERAEAFARFRDRFSAHRIGQSYVIEISYSSAYPELAARIANAGASAYLLQSVSFTAAAASGGAEFVQSRVDALEREVAAAAAAVRQGTLPEILISNADARIIGAALVPLEPSAPRVKLIAALGGMLGLLTGIFVIAMRSALNRKVGDGRKLGTDYDLGILAVIPKAKTSARGDRGKAFAMAVRDLRTAINLSFGTESQDRSRSIALVSWSVGTGCSTIATSLAEVMRKAGRETVVVDADMRGGKRGLTWHFRHSSPVEDPDGLKLLNVAGSRLLPSSELADYSEKLADTRDPGVADVFRRMRSLGDVLLDLSPLSESSDARALARHADAVILIATPNCIIDEIVEAARQIEQSGAMLFGVVINNPGRSGFSSHIWQEPQRPSPRREVDAKTRERVRA
ncbi:hypothetical protein E4191_22120 (plasmid) [Paracoccus liaowanqingii]|uniref:Polysaccharide chain length determinant N-terminal domain-containing protein n=1 Tax=Paracoccus liaowanqingii TaxID=2560053 RepID=A0A4Y5SUY8_9RHOB|nr:hypothetical protein [Paracoccus liaowanqingii]QDA36783.1 hypothetical protein E4191_22120 [Paracoccus liaowanqingii]